VTAARLGRLAGLVSAATAASRLLGLVREQVFAATLGASNVADAFVGAFRLPNLWRDLLAEGALSAALVPAYRAELTNRGEAAAHRLSARLLGNVLVAVGLAVILAMLAAPALAELFLGDFANVPGKLDLAATLLTAMLPFILIASVTAIAMGVQQAREHFVAPALSPAVFNLVSIAIGIGLALSGRSTREVAIGWAVGTLLAGLAQLGLQVPSLWRLGWRPRLGLDLRLRDPAVRRVVVTMGPAIIAGAAIQLNVFIDTMFAAQDPGAVAWLGYAFRFLQLPLGIFAVAIATVSTTRYADAAAARDPQALASHVADGLRLISFLCVPAMVGLVLDGDAIVRLIYQHGRFAPRDTAATGAALDVYALGLPAYAAIKVLAPATYAFDRARLAAAAAAVAIVGHYLGDRLLHERGGFEALAASTATAAYANAAILYLGIHRGIAALPHRALADHLARVMIAAAVMGGVVWSVAAVLEDAVGGGSLAARAITALGPVVAGAATYAAATVALGVPEARAIVRRLRRR
jgi:putative peptidoglycan lipid II flippase